MKVHPKRTANCRANPMNGVVQLPKKKLLSHALAHCDGVAQSAPSLSLPSARARSATPARPRPHESPLLTKVPGQGCMLLPPTHAALDAVVCLLFSAPPFTAQLLFSSLLSPSHLSSLFTPRRPRVNAKRAALEGRTESERKEASPPRRQRRISLTSEVDAAIIKANNSSAEGG